MPFGQWFPGWLSDRIYVTLCAPVLASDWGQCRISPATDDCLYHKEDFFFVPNLFLLLTVELQTKLWMESRLWYSLIMVALCQTLQAPTQFSLIYTLYFYMERFLLRIWADPDLCRTVLHFAELSWYSTRWSKVPHLTRFGKKKSFFSNVKPQRGCEMVQNWVKAIKCDSTSAFVKLF